MDRIFQIGGFCFRMICPDEITPPENFLLFESEKSTPSHCFELQLSEQFPEARGRLAASRRDIAVFEEKGLETRYIGFPDSRASYACCHEADETHTLIHIAPRFAGIDWIDPMFLSLFSMERHMIRHGSLVLHCAYMLRGDHAILFSAPSGTGKTTQASLWQKHRGTRVINGDKALLMKKDGAWTANGWPVCGSSGVCHNESAPIRAIVMLSQGRENTIARLAPFQAFAQIYSQMTINPWNREAQQRAMDLIEELVTRVPVYHLSCTISEDAVKCLENALAADERKESAEE